MKFEVDWLRFSLFSRGGLPEPPPQSWQGLSDVSLIRVNVFLGDPWVRGHPYRISDIWVGG